MHYRRRWVLGLLSIVACGVSLDAAAKTKTTAPALDVPAAPQLIAQLKKTHPRLLVDQADFDRLRQRIAADAGLKQWDDALHRRADELLDAKPLRHVLPDGLRLLATSRAMLERSYTLALTYRLHGDRRHADRLSRDIQTVAAFPDFNPRHFLDTAEMTQALAIAYDWLYDTWADSQRATIRQAIVRLGLKPGLAVYRSGSGWPRSEHNWNQVCNGGMTMGALALGDEEPELAGEVLRHAIASVPRAMASYAPDGAWGEGPSYWAYATAYDVGMIAALQSALGSDFGISETAGFAETGLFPIYMAGPTGLPFNFSDAHLRRVAPPCLFWLARRFERPVYAWAAAQGEPTAQGLLWYQKNGPDPAAAGLPLDKHFRHVDVVTMRGRWNDPQATFVGIQAGTNRVNHNHLDLGGFVLDALGERWAVDLGGDNYNLPGYFGGQRYTYYRLRAEGHNTLVLNPGAGPDQDPKATARIARFVSEPARAFTIADLTPAYARHARRVERGVALLERRRVLVQDEIEAEQPAAVWWFLHTPAEISLAADGRSATLRINKSKLLVEVLVPAAARLTTRAAEPLPTSPHPADQGDNSDVRKLAIELPHVSNIRLAVLFTPLDGKPATRPPELKPLAEW